MWLSVLLIMISSQPVTASIWSIQNYFGECNLRFLSWGGNIRNNPPPYFHDILVRNPTSPISLNHILMNATRLQVLGSASSLIIPHSRSGRDSVAFIDISHTNKSMYGTVVPYNIHLVVLLYFNPSYIFQHTDEPLNPINVKGYFNHAGNPKLIIFCLTSPRQIFIPCIACYGSSILRINTIPLRDLGKFWWSENNNLQRKGLEVEEDLDLSRINCGVSYIPGKFTWLRYCKIVHLIEKLNFSVVLGNKISKTPIYAVTLRKSLSGTIKFLTRKPIFYTPFSVEFEYAKFSVITKYPHALEGMNAFLLPLSGPVWAGLLISCGIICLMAQPGSDLKNWVETMQNIGLNLMQITAILLGQVTRESLKIFGNQTFGAPIMLAWLLGGRYIIMDNLYTGTIFSYLSAIKPPIVPETLHELVHSLILDIFNYDSRLIAKPLALTCLLLCTYKLNYRTFINMYILYTYVPGS